MKEEKRIIQRKRPAHHPFIEQHNRSVILLLTVCSKNRRPVFNNEELHQTLRETWALSKQWHVGRYMIMPDHMHLFCSPTCRESENVAEWTAYWKRAVSRKHPELKPLWQRDCWDTQLRRHESYTEKWNYVLQNPVRASLVECTEDWPYQGEIFHLPW